jgi:hypothetical protein
MVYTHARGPTILTNPECSESTYIYNVGNNIVGAKHNEVIFYT